MPFSTLSLSTHGPLAVIHLNRPDQGNPVDEALLDDLDAASVVIADDPSVSVVQLTAEGTLFSRGWSGPPPASGRLPFRSLERLPQPVLACVSGDAVGAGLELALACDLRIATAAAHFTMPLPAADAAWLGAQRLPRLIGRGRAAEMLLLGGPISAATARAWGLVNAIAADRVDLADLAGRLTQTIASRSPLALRYAKEAIAQGLEMPLEQALRYETDLTVILQTTADRAEGVRAFMEKRPPHFTGR
ncbi:MAG TPA: enoyl-CoA hydratase/isomerase family protein [Dehalococcoidia bacterium]|nr:enoyl-CoA hydratase/isomerase family protein [Dehalococcoidia bacterium]